jgi:hypothetical protein
MRGLTGSLLRDHAADELRLDNTEPDRGLRKSEMMARAGERQGWCL